MGRPLSGKSAPKGRISLIDRMSPGGVYVPPTISKQFESTVAPATEPVAVPTETVAPKKPTQVSESEEIAANKKRLEAERVDRDIKAYAAKKAQKEAAAKLKKK